MQVGDMLVSVIFSYTGLHDGLEGGVSVADTDVMSEEKIRVSVILLLDPACSRDNSQRQVRKMSSQLPAKTKATQSCWKFSQMQLQLLFISSKIYEIIRLHSSHYSQLCLTGITIFCISIVIPRGWYA